MKISKEKSSPPPSPQESKHPQFHTPPPKKNPHHLPPVVSKLTQPFPWPDDAYPSPSCTSLSPACAGSCWPPAPRPWAPPYVSTAAWPACSGWWGPPTAPGCWWPAGQNNSTSQVCLMIADIALFSALSLRLHVVLQEWLAFYSAFFEYPPKWCT